jgi:hypothetical protein
MGQLAVCDAIKIQISNRQSREPVIRGFDPRIHQERIFLGRWIAGSSPAMTAQDEALHSHGTNVPEFLPERLPPMKEGVSRDPQERARATLKREGAGNAGRSIAPIASCASKKAHGVVATGTPKHPAFPAQWF